MDLEKAQKMVYQGQDGRIYLKKSNVPLTYKDLLDMDINVYALKGIDILEMMEAYDLIKDINIKRRKYLI